MPAVPLISLGLSAAAGVASYIQNADAAGQAKKNAASAQAQIGQEQSDEATLTQNINTRNAQLAAFGKQKAGVGITYGSSPNTTVNPLGASLLPPAAGGQSGAKTYLG